MNDKRHPYERIEQYIAGTLDAQEKTTFEAQMSVDNSLQEEVALHRDLQDALADEEVLELENLLLELRAGGSKQTNIRSLWSRKPYLSIAAAILFICVLGFLFWPKPPTNDYTAYFETYDLYIGTRSADDNYEQQLNNLTQAYANKDYDQALASLNQLRQTKPEDKALHFYQAYCQYQIGLFSEAEKNFTNILEGGDSAYLSPTEWYLVDVYLQQDKLEQAIARLQQIKNQKGDYSSQAADLLKDLN